MNDTKTSEAVRCFVIIAITTTAIAIVGETGRAFFYTQARHVAPYLPFLTGSIALCAAGISRRKRIEAKDTDSGTGTAENRRVRVTGPVK